MDPYTAQVTKKDASGQEIKDDKGNPVMEEVKVETQTIPLGPVASQEVIKEFGINGGGFFNANSAHPFENPTPLTNFLEMLLIFAIPAALTYTYGRMARDQKEGWVILGAMGLLFLLGVGAAYWAEARGNTVLAGLAVDQTMGNLEGKEMRFGVAGSSLFATITTGASCGAVNSMHDSFTPLGGLVPLVNMQLGEVIFGGVGAGLYGMLVFVILAVFIAGLMVGRTPEYLTIHPRQEISLFNRSILGPAAWESLKKLSPQLVIKNPVMFVVEVGAVLTAILWFRDFLSTPAEPLWFTGQVCLWLWFTVVFANFAEAVAEGRGKAQAAELKKMRREIMARKMEDGKEVQVPASQLRRGDVVVAEAGDYIPGDGDVIEGIASVDESAVTGESAPVIREAGGDRSAVTGGTKVLSDRILVRITADPGGSFLDKMIALVEGAVRQKTPNEIALHILLVGLTIIFLIACVTLIPVAAYSRVTLSATVIAALLVCLIPTTIGGLLSAIGIAGMDRLIRKNVLAMSGRAVEAAGDVDTLLLDKTGTITLGARMASELIPAPGIPAQELAMAAGVASFADETPEGRSIVEYVKKNYGLAEADLKPPGAQFIPFSAHTRMSGCDAGGMSIRKGAGDAIVTQVQALGGKIPGDLAFILDGIGDAGGTPLVVSQGDKVMGVIYLKDIIKKDIKERFDRFRAMGIKTVMITGDNPRTAATIAKEAGVDDFLAEATPERKMRLIKEEQAKGKMVAMTGDGTNDAPALAQADVGMAMNTGTQAAKEAGNMIDLDSNPTKLLEVVEVGKQLLMTRGALTTFSVANDVAKYFAILPAMFVAVYPEIAPLNLMGLASPQSAILSAVIFNALIIVLLIPLALKGVRYRPLGAGALLRRLLLLYGVGGLIAPFVGIKLIDLLLAGVGF